MKCPRCNGTGDNPNITPFKDFMPIDGLRCSDCKGTGICDEILLRLRAEAAVDDAWERNR